MSITYDYRLRIIRLSLCARATLVLKIKGILDLKNKGVVLYYKRDSSNTITCPKARDPSEAG
jgi:hypothetical protein